MSHQRGREREHCRAEHDQQRAGIRPRLARAEFEQDPGERQHGERRRQHAQHEVQIPRVEDLRARRNAVAVRADAAFERIDGREQRHAEPGRAGRFVRVVMPAVLRPVGGVHLPPLGVQVAVNAERIRVVAGVLEERGNRVEARDLVHVPDMEEPRAEDERGEEKDEGDATTRGRRHGHGRFAGRGRGNFAGWGYCAGRGNAVAFRSVRPPVLCVAPFHGAERKIRTRACGNCRRSIRVPWSCRVRRSRGRRKRRGPRGIPW